MKQLKIIGLCGLLMLLVACGPIVPATTPPQLEHTPGAFVVVSASTYTTDSFQVDYLSDWRIVKTSIAAADNHQVVFVAPDETSITLTQVEVVGDDAGDEQFIVLDNDIIIQVLIELAEEADLRTESQINQLVQSIRP